MCSINVLIKGASVMNSLCDMKNRQLKKSETREEQPSDFLPLLEQTNT